jgi:hypothetical protein
MNEIMEFLPFLIPLVIVQFALLGYTLYHILTHKTYKRGNRVMWLIISIAINFFGPIAYLVLGREDS